jgi:hypothetical protein
MVYSSPFRSSFIVKGEVFVAINLNRGDLEIALAIQKGVSRVC